MVSRSESRVAKQVLAIVAALPVDRLTELDAELRELSAALEWFLPEVLRHQHDALRRLELDQVRISRVVQAGPTEIEVTGLALYIEDQTWTPVRALLRASSAGDCISWARIKFGELDSSGRETRISYDSFNADKLVHRLLLDPDRTNWQFMAERSSEEPPN